MHRLFNTTGPNIASEHYLVDPLSRLGAITELIEQKKYFVLRAGRQLGKTTSAQVLMKHYNCGDKYCALWVDLETAREQPEPVLAFRTILNAFDRAMERTNSGWARPTREQRELFLQDPSSALLQYLLQICKTLPRPLILFLDEADCLVGPAMVSFLTQLRDGYIGRQDTSFPQSIILVGQREIRDYMVTKEEGKVLSWLGTASPFNITAESVTLEMFTREQVTGLLHQHTEETGQVFEADAVEHVMYLSNGHPWLVNALADYSVMRLERDRTNPITKAHIEKAKEALISERRTHIDSLLAKLKEDRVKRVIAPMLVGDRASGDSLDDDLMYCVGLGLLEHKQGNYHIANPIYREVIPRALTFSTQSQIYQFTTWYQLPDGSLDMTKLMKAWQKFWRIDGHLAAEGFNYREAGPHLMMMAFLQRIVNGGGRIYREYALGKGAIDLLLEWPLKDGSIKQYGIELKIRRDTETEDEALEQAVQYWQEFGLSEGWVVLFDLRKNQTWEQKLAIRDLHVQDKIVHVVGS